MKEAVSNTQSQRESILRYNPFFFKHGSRRFIQGKGKWTPGKWETFVRTSLRIPICLFVLCGTLLILYGEKDRLKWWGLLLFAVIVLAITITIIADAVERFEKENHLAKGKLILGRVLNCTYVEGQFTPSDAPVATRLYQVRYEFTTPEGRILQGDEKHPLFEKDLPPIGKSMVVLYLNDKDFMAL
jgi:hypothetical protein